MSNFQTYLLREADHVINIYDYFDKEHVWVFTEGQNMEDITVTIHEGDLEVDAFTELSADVQDFLVVKGNLTVKEDLLLVGYYQPPHNIGALIVTGNVSCKNMFLSWGDIAVMGNLTVEQYIFLDVPEFEQGSLAVHGNAHIPYLFRLDEHNPSIYI